MFILVYCVEKDRIWDFMEKKFELDFQKWVRLYTEERSLLGEKEIAWKWI